MSCLDREQLFRYSHHRLNPPELERVRGHLGECPRCRQAVVDYERLDTVLDEWKVAEPSAWFDARVRRAVEAQPAGRWAWNFWGRRWARTLALVSLGAFVIAGALWLTRSPRPVITPAKLVTKPPREAGPAPASPEVARLKAVAPAPMAVKKSGAPPTTVKVVNSSPAEGADARALDDDDLVANFDILSELPKKDSRVDE